MPRRAGLLLCVFMTLVPFNFAEDAGTGSAAVIRVAISRNTTQFTLKTSGKVYALELKTGQKYMLLERSVYEVKYISPARLAVAGATLESPVKLVAADGGDRIKLNGRFYRGDLYMRTTAAEKLEVIEHLSIEDYLYGVLPVEMSPDWPLEALKAQAVASRTYALKNANPKKDYDITDGADTQVYNGASGMNERIIDAVNSTRGEVLKYKGKLITAFFHACCGGHTASANSALTRLISSLLTAVIRVLSARSRTTTAWPLFVTHSSLIAERPMQRHLPGNRKR